MKRILLTLLTGVAMLGGLLVAPANASAASAALAANPCTHGDRHEFGTDKNFPANECYSTPGGVFLMQTDGNFVNYNPPPGWGAKCASDTAGWHGANAYFQHDGNLVILYFGTPIKHSGTHGNYGATLVYNANGRLRILNAQRHVIWDMCNHGFRWV
jgi:hypothetical protein